MPIASETAVKKVADRDDSSRVTGFHPIAVYEELLVWQKQKTVEVCVVGHPTMTIWGAVSP
ncbi:hypothetical protein [Natronorubrum aibiense]|uniref:Uncharacterized protein n=1 Tax=Natronorubrum aibiense TaxID=348826 RepID=A0A5P9P387_9EURY|nr:hypothetical protein [Natronorubrum aibiense]QFU82615.1 hypothetical protein GCU68_08825 [Natronorubrum aibiense]